MKGFSFSLEAWEREVNESSPEIDVAEAGNGQPGVECAGREQRKSVDDGSTRDSVERKIEPQFGSKKMTIRATHKSAIVGRSNAIQLLPRAACLESWSSSRLSRRPSSPSKRVKTLLQGFSP